MYAQSLPISRYILHQPQSNQHQKLAFNPKSKSGFSNSAKRVSISTVSSRNSGQMPLLACGGLQITQKQQQQQQEEKLDDGYYMRRCVELAKKAIGCTSPNPMVGCVIVKDGKIVGEGFHPKAGQPHAEVFALRDAGDLAENGTAYVSLEPCNHYGRTPPCSEALIKAKVRKVVVGMVDPNPVVDSTGIKKLQDAGIEVKVGVEEEMCKKLNEAFIHRMVTGKPFVTLRYSISLDGHFLNQLGEEAMESGGYYSKLLQEYDGVLLSSKSIAENSSFPISKEPGANQPLKILVSRNPDSLIQIPALDVTPPSKVMIISEKKMSVDSPEIVQEGVQRLSFDKISLPEILEQCKQQGLNSVLLDLSNLVDFEVLLKEGIEQNLFQKVLVEVLPHLSGGGDRLPNFVNLKAEVKKLTSRFSGKSVILEGYL